MSNLTCYLVDDEPTAIQSLTSLIQLYYPSLQVNGSATTVNDAIKYLTNNDIDLLFLDIKMQGETGFDLLRQLHTYSFHLVFVTAYDEYGIQAIKFSATDYLLKPVNPEELIAAVHKISTRKQLQHEQIQLLLQSQSQQEHHLQKRIALAGQTEIKYVRIEDIICCESDNTYTRFYLANESSAVLVSKPITEYENLLEPYGFVRTHQSWLINKNKLSAYKKESGGYLLMENKMMVPVSRQRKHLLKTL